MIKTVNYPKYILLLTATLFCFSLKAQLKADFTVDIADSCSPLHVQFKDLSSGNPTEWKWDLGDGTISTVQDPSIVYINPGTYSVKLIVKDATGAEDTLLKVDYIHVHPDPDVQFTATPTSSCPPLTVQFNNQSTAGPGGTISQLTWDFGDGDTSHAFSPAHTYTSSDTFPVFLTIVNNYGCRKTLLKDKFINVFNNVTTDFDYSSSNACQLPAQVIFKNLSVSNSPLTYEWLFGDGQVSTDRDPTHPYTQSGTFQVKLLATTDSGCTDTITKTISIGTVNPDFLLPADSCINKPLSFINTSSPSPISVKWTFGDGDTANTIDAVHTYTTAGTYTVKMTADFENCPASSISKNITVLNKPVPAFSVSGNLATCTIPNAINFNNSSTNAISYKWLFGDGDSSIENNPAHTYTKSGFFTITLIAFNSMDCSDTLIKPDFIQTGPPRILSLENLPFEGCGSQTIKPKAIIQSPEPLVSYLWDFGDGSTSTDSVPTHKYSNPGTYNVTLIVVTNSGCSDTLTITGAVKLGVLPTPKFSATPLSACASTSIHFTDESTGAITSWLWDFGDSTISRLQNPDHLYRDTGFFSVTLTAENNGCKDSVQLKNYIHINAPISHFSTTFQCDANFTRSFIDSSIGATSWKWDFGDGSLPLLTQKASHTYTDTGTYVVTLTVTNGTCTDVSTDIIKIINENPSFTYKPHSAICKYRSVTFTAANYTPSSVNGLLWNFGDGVLMTGDSVTTHSYNRAGTFFPYLVVTYINGCKDTISKDQVDIHVYGPTASFSNPEGTCINGTIPFTDESIPDSVPHPIIKWIWDYGDNIVDTLTQFQAIVSHTYNSIDSFNVKLVLYDSMGCKDSLIKTNAVIITKPVANFSLLDSTRCTVSGANFLNTSTGLTLNSLWDFGDGSTSTDQTPVHLYPSEGVYTVKLIVTDKFGCTDSITKNDIVTISNPIASFILTDTFGICPPLIIQPVNTSQNYLSVTWDFDDGGTSEFINPFHSFIIPGQYNVTLIVKGHGECYDTAGYKVLLKGPSGEFNYTPFQGCSPATVSFTSLTKNTVNYLWDFNNGVTKKTKDSMLTYTYDGYGQYIPKLVLIDSSGCEVSLVNTDTITIAEINAGFKTTQQIQCDSSLVTFQDSSIAYNDLINSYEWNFGDNATSALPNTIHYYKDSGTYNISLTVTTTLGCKDTLIVPLTVQINKSPQLSLSAPDSSCIFLPVNFRTSYVNRDTPLVWKWDLGDGSVDVTPNPIHTYSASGVLNVKATVTNQLGCSSTLNHTIEIIPTPNIYAGSDTFVCSGNVIQLQASGADKYLWSPDPSLSCTTCNNPDARPDSSTTYYVQGATNFGCIASDSINVEVKPSIHLVTTSLIDSLCTGESVQLNASGAEIYNWQPSAGLSDGTIANPIASPSATTIYTLVGSDNKGCFADTATVTVKVFPLPVFNIIDSAITLDLGSTYTLKTTNTPDIVRWLWNPPTWLSCNNCAQPVAQPRGDITYTAQVSTATGCTASDNINIRVLCNGLNFYMPNTFSPNNDGRNDWFFPRGKGQFDIRSLRIFNRWGQMVFEKNNLSVNNERDGWNGNFNGKPVLSDVYVYVLEMICTNGQISTLKGNVTLIR